MRIKECIDCLVPITGPHYDSRVSNLCLCKDCGDLVLVEREGLYYFEEEVGQVLLDDMLSDFESFELREEK